MHTLTIKTTGWAAIQRLAKEPRAAKAFRLQVQQHHRAQQIETRPRLVRPQTVTQGFNAPRFL